jgi:hypothetical protein
MSGQFHTLVALPPGKEPPVSNEQEAGRALGQVCMLWREKKILASVGNRTLHTHLSDLQEILLCGIDPHSRSNNLNKFNVYECLHVILRNLLFFSCLKRKKVTRFLVTVAVMIHLLRERHSYYHRTGFIRDFSWPRLLSEGFSLLATKARAIWTLTKQVTSLYYKYYNYRNWVLK